jgi:16S rRNA (guanine966-N2)-methyltransferase
MLRIIGGRHKGRRLKMVRDPRIRPMPAKLKESLFNLLQEKVKEADCLDGFAGSGAVGLEALSRGAATVVFIEEYGPAVKIIKQNIERCGFQDRTRVLAEEFNRGVIRLSKEKKRFDIIFIDPPYALLLERNPLKVVKKRDLLKPNGIIALRHFNKINPDLRFFERFRLLRSGDDVISFFRHRLETEAGKADSSARNRQSLTRSRLCPQEVKPRR